MMGGLILGGVPRASWAADKFALTVDGNSIVDPGNGSTLTAKIKAASPIADNPGFVFTDCAISGQTFQGMASGSTDVLNAYQVGKTNFLLIWEISNTIRNGANAQSCIDDMLYCIETHQKNLRTRYPNERPWVVLAATCLPASATTHDQENELKAVNAYLRANYRSMGIRAIVEVRQPGSVFDVQDVTDSSKFGWTKDGLHPTAAADTLLAGYVSEVLMRLPAR